jgi:hypothetical protein
MRKNKNKNTDSLRNTKLEEEVNPWDLLDNLVLSNVNEFKKILEGKNE